MVERKKYCVNGEWRESKTDKWMPVTDSSTGELLAEVPCCTVDEVESAIAAAEALSPGLVKYTTGKFTVYFNANDDAKDINESGKQIVINETNGTYSTAANGRIAKVAGKGFVIIEK